MSTAETEAVEMDPLELERIQRQKKMMEWRPPSAPHGSIVLFYKDGVKTAIPPVPMVVYTGSRSGRTINLRPLAGGEARMGVRFLGDPRNDQLDESELRRTGAWDFTEEHYFIDEVRQLIGQAGSGGGDSTAVEELRTRMDGIEKGMAALGHQITELIKGNAGK